jgi:hypothetical protein
MRQTQLSIDHIMDFIALIIPGNKPVPEVSVIAVQIHADPV